MKIRTPPHTMSISNVFDTLEEAEAFRMKLMYPHLYGLYGMWQSDERQLWVVMPQTALDAINDFREPRDE